MKKLVKILKWTGIVLALIIVALFAFVQLTWNKKFDAPYPDIKASTDSAIVARGKYLAFGPSHCATCHVPLDKIMEVEKGLEIPLSGGWEMSIPGMGTFRAPNITPDPETGIGKLSDGDLARTLRHGVGSDGRFIMPFMPYQNMSDEDMVALISFLRSQPAVKHEVARTELGLLGKTLMAFGVLKPEGAVGTPPVSVPRDTSAEYGKYLAHNVANCYGCHTRMDLNTGKNVGQDFAGGTAFKDEFTKGHTFVTPNLTPHPETGQIAHWSQMDFIRRMKGGRLNDLTPMPWGAYARFTEDDTKAIYSYLKTLEPVNHKIAKTEYAPNEQVPIYTNVREALKNK